MIDISLLDFLRAHSIVVEVDKQLYTVYGFEKEWLNSLYVNFENDYEISQPDNGVIVIKKLPKTMNIMEWALACCERIRFVGTDMNIEMINLVTEPQIILGDFKARSFAKEYRLFRSMEKNNLLLVAINVATNV